MEETAQALKERGIRTFYDQYETVNLWGKDLCSSLDDVYGHLSLYCIVFVSRSYVDSVWMKHEQRSAQARKLIDKDDYILPVRFDDTRIPGLPATVHYIDGNRVSPTDLADLFKGKLKGCVRFSYLPPFPNRLYERLGVEDDATAQESVLTCATSFLDVLGRMNGDEKSVILEILGFGCPTEMPDNVHVNIDALRRHTGKSTLRLREILGGVRSLGFESWVARSHADDATAAVETTLGDSYVFKVSWQDLTVGNDCPVPSLSVASEMIQGATEGLCEKCGAEHLKRLDFSQLSTAVMSEDSHL